MRKSFKRKYDDTTLLPKELEAKINAQNPDGQTSSSKKSTKKGSFKNKKTKAPLTRKEQRKQSRVLKKVKKSEYYNKSKNSNEETPLPSQINKKSKIPQPNNPQSSTSVSKKSIKDSQPPAKTKKSETTKKVSFNLNSDIDNVPQPDPEDVLLQELEKKLGIKKSSEIDKYLEQDGLGSLLKGITVGSKKLKSHPDSSSLDAPIFAPGKKLTPLEKKIAQIKNQYIEDSNDILSVNDNMSEISGDEEEAQFNSSDLDMLNADDDSESEYDSNLEFPDQDIDLDELSYSNDDLNESDYDSDSENIDNSLLENISTSESESIHTPLNESSKSNNVNSTKLNENSEKLAPQKPAPNSTTAPESIKNPETTAKYIPPRLRNLMLKDSEKNSRIRKLVQGQLNRLSESNVERIVIEIEKIYSSNPRHDVTEAATDILISSISSKIHMLDTFLYVNAAFVGALSRIVGIEASAYLVQELVERIDRNLKGIIDSTKSAVSTITDLKSTNLIESDEKVSPGKETLNLVSFLSELYNFHVISCRLIYDLLDYAASYPNETTIEIILAVIKTAGYQLRKDEPLLLKNLCLVVTANFKNLNNDQVKSTVRCNFMLEQLGNLRNNRMKQVMLSSADCVIPLKKFLQNLDKKRHTISPEPINVGLDDIRQIDTKGKWWLVGSYWAGVDDKSKGNNKDNSGLSAIGSFSDTSANKESNQKYQQLLLLAKAFKMNTDVRKSIFIAIMSSQDAVDAFEKCMKLGLKESQQREIIRVLVLLVGQ
ncbi:Suppressor of glycerol defect protein 1, partial [Smittium culicis]